MDLINFLFGTRARITTDNVWTDGGVSYTGRTIDDDAALRVSTVYICIRVLAETLGSLPLILYRRIESGKERATDHPLYSILHRKPNNYQTPFLWKEMMMGHIQLRGRACAQVVKDRGKRVSQIIPLDPDRIKLYWGPDNKIFGEYTEDDLAKKKRIITPEQLLYIPGLSGDPLSPFVPLDLMATSVDAALSMNENSAQFFAKSTRPSGILKYPTRINEEKARALRQEFDRANAGTENAFSTILLEEGLDWEQIGMSNEQSQFIQSREFSVSDICRFFRVPPHLAGDLRRATYSNIEHQSLEFIKYTMAPWLKRFEEIMNLALLNEADQEDYFIEFLVDGLLRGDVKTRHEAYAIGVQNGWLSRNEVREMENRNRVDGLDEMLLPLNMSSDGGEQDEEDEKDDTDAEDDAAQTELETDALRPVLEDAIRRILRKESKMPQRALTNGDASKHETWIAEVLRSIFKSLNAESNLEVFARDFVARSVELRVNNKSLNFEREIDREVRHLLGATNEKRKTLGRVH